MAAERQLEALLFQKAARTEDPKLDAAIAAQEQELEQLKAAHRVRCLPGWLACRPAGWPACWLAGLLVLG